MLQRLQAMATSMLLIRFPMSEGRLRTFEGVTLRRPPSRCACNGCVTAMLQFFVMSLSPVSTCHCGAAKLHVQRLFDHLTCCATAQLNTPEATAEKNCWLMLATAVAAAF